MAKRDYYEVLGVDRDSGSNEIKKAYRRLAMKFHPDRNKEDPEAQEHFKEASEAYAVLSDDDKRSTYDRFGHDGLDLRGGVDFGSDIFGDLGDIFSGFFGSRSQRRGPQRGRDLQYTQTITLEQAVRGDKVEVSIPALRHCDSCDASGAAAGSSPSTCPDCGGTGQIGMSRGFFSVRQTCPRCRGEGRVITHPCRDCGGTGRVNKTKKLSITIPPGVEETTQLKLRGEGEDGQINAAPGDLLVVFDIKPHETFTREGKHLFCEVPISFPQAALGAEVDIPTLDGTDTLKISPGTQTGSDFRLRGRGVTSINERHSGQGDLIVRVVIETPVKLSDQQKQLLENLQQSLEDGMARHSPKRSSWMSSVRGFLDDIANG